MNKIDFQSAYAINKKFRTTLWQPIFNVAIYVKNLPEKVELGCPFANLGSTIFLSARNNYVSNTKKMHYYGEEIMGRAP